MADEGMKFPSWDEGYVKKTAERMRAEEEAKKKQQIRDMTKAMPESNVGAPDYFYGGKRRRRTSRRSRRKSKKSYKRKSMRRRRSTRRRV